MFVAIVSLIVLVAIVRVLAALEVDDHEHRSWVTGVERKRSETVLGKTPQSTSSASSNPGLGGRWVSGRGLVWTFKGCQTESVELDDGFLASDEAKALVAMHMLQNGMDTTSEAAIHAAMEDIVELFNQIDEDPALLERPSEVIPMHEDVEDEEDEPQLVRRDETIRME